MKIVVTKDEFARLIRECESQNTGYSICSSCVMKSFCQGDTQIENFCEIEIMGTVGQNRLQEFYYNGTPSIQLCNDPINCNDTIN